MLKSKLKDMQQVQAFIDHLDEQQIMNFITKQHFQASSQQFQAILHQQSLIDPLKSLDYHKMKSRENDIKALLESNKQFSWGEQDIYNNPLICNRKSISSNLFSMIQSRDRDSEIQQIQQIQNRFKMLACSDQPYHQELSQSQFRFQIHKDKATQLSQVSQVLQKIKKEITLIKNSGLKVTDFMDVYENIGQQPINDPIVKKIVTFFQTTTKQFSLFQFIQTVQVYLNQSSNGNVDTNKIDEIRRSINENDKQMVDQSIIDSIQRIARVYTSIRNVMTTFEQ